MCQHRLMLPLLCDSPQFQKEISANDVQQCAICLTQQRLNRLYVLKLLSFKYRCC